jgi:hypothetical protein
MSLQLAIRRIVEPLLPPPVVIGEVLKVDETNLTCDVGFENSPTRFDVRLRAVIDGSANGIMIIPKVGSKVVVDTIQGNKMMSYVALVSEVERVELFGKEQGGIPIASAIAERLAIIEKDLNGLKDALGAWKTPPAAPDSGALIITLVQSFVNKKITVTKLEDIENKNVLHG